jgi:hypothetical protein
MRRFPLLIAVTLTIIVAAPIASAAAASHDKAVGTGTIAGFGDPTVDLSANQNKPGLRGSFTITYPDGTLVTGKPTCLVLVGGNTAYVTGRITQASGARQVRNNWFPDGFLIIGVLDNGTSGTDKLNFSPGFASDPGCGPNSAATPNLALSAGDFTVSDVA